MEEEEINVIMNKNWNRMAEISRFPKRNELLQAEMDYRRTVHNKMTNDNLSKEEQEKIIKDLLDFNEKVRKKGFNSKWLK